MTCLACHIQAEQDPVMTHANCFLAGVAFAMSHNDRACYAALCAKHKAIMLDGEARAAHAIHAQDAR